jgi:limonene-1,2-epoxide hydrolase
MQASAVETVQSFMEAMKAFDIERTSALLADDVEYQNVPFPPHRGREATLRVLRGFMKAFNRFDVEIHNVAEREGVVLTERTDILASRFHELRFWVCGTFEVRDGKIALWRDRFDLATVAYQLATSPLRKLLSTVTPRLEARG